MDIQKDIRRTRQQAGARTTHRQRGRGWSWRRFRHGARRLREAVQELEER